MRRIKLVFALFGFLTTGAGIFFDSRPLIWVAIVALAVALGIRLWERSRTGGQSDGRSEA